MIPVKLCFVQPLSHALRRDSSDAAERQRRLRGLATAAAYGSTPQSPTVTAPLIVGPLAGRLRLTAEGNSSKPQCITAKSPVSPEAPLLGQQRRPPPVAETGRSCWGSGQQDASAKLCTKRTLGAATRTLASEARLRGLTYKKISRFRLEPGDFFSLDFYDARSQKTVTRVLPP